MQVVAIVLAAGKGTRMGGSQPKVLCPLAGSPLIHYPLALVGQLGAVKTVVVVGFGADMVRAAVNRESVSGVEFAFQASQRGTGHAVQCAMPALANHEGPVLILSGDVPLLRLQTVRELIQSCCQSPAGLAFLVFHPVDKKGYGRVLRDKDGRVSSIQEERDADTRTQALSECNAGVYCAMASLLTSELPSLRTENSQQEFYLTDLVAAAAQLGKIETIQVDPIEVAGVNTLDQLAALERSYLARKQGSRA